MSTFNPPAPLNALTKARSVDINELTDSIATAFAALPSDADLNNGTVNFGTDAGVANAYVVTLPRTPTGYVNGLRVVFSPLFSNTGASTVNVNGLGVIPIRLQDNSPAEPGTLVAGIPKTLIYSISMNAFYVEANSTAAASTSAAQAAASASAAASSAAAAFASAESIALTANSTSNLALGVGTKIFAILPGKPFQIGAPVRATSASDLSKKMDGIITGYSGTTLTTRMDTFTGVGSASDWAITVTGAIGPQGLTGGVNGGDLTASLNEKRGADVAAAGTLDIWSSGGNNFTLTGTTTITGFTAAPQAGARRRLLASANTPLTDGANFIIKGGSLTLTPGDEVDVVAETTTKFLLTVHRFDGQATKTTPGFSNLVQLTTTGSFTVKKTGWHQFIMTGGGGQGGAVMNSSQGAATGGGAGGFTSKVVFLIVGQTVNYTRGGGAAAGVLSAVGVRNGTDGGMSVLTGPGISLVAMGGEGGKTSISTGGPAVAGGVGGIASGGDVNYQGGDGGSILAGAWKAGTWLASGGGAVTIQGERYSAGSPNTFSSTSGLYAATGGAGVGGNSGSATSPGSVASSSGGGGSGGPSPNTASLGGAGGVNYAGVAAGAAAPFGMVLANATAGGQASGSATTWADHPGGGSGGLCIDTTAGGTAGAFAGSGGLAFGSSNLRNTAGGPYGGGVGGVAMQAASGGTTVSASDGGTLFIYY